MRICDEMLTHIVEFDVAQCMMTIYNEMLARMGVGYSEEILWNSTGHGAQREYVMKC